VDAALHSLNLKRHYIESNRAADPKSDRLLEGVTDSLVALETGHLLLLSVPDECDGSAVALEAVLLENAVSPGFGPYGVGRPESERNRVVKAILRLGKPFSEEGMGNVALVAGHTMVAGTHPALKVFPHDVAIDAGLRVIEHVGVSLREPEGIDAGANHQA
jgi:hypothetical protein